MKLWAIEYYENNWQRTKHIEATDLHGALKEFFSYRPRAKIITVWEQVTPEALSFLLSHPTKKAGKD